MVQINLKKGIHGTNERLLADRKELADKKLIVFVYSLV